MTNGTIRKYVTVFPFYSFSDRLRFVLVAIGGLLDSIIAIITLGNIKTEFELPLIAWHLDTIESRESNE